MTRSRRKKPPVRLRRTSGAWRFEWTEDLVALLGVLPDAAVGAKAGLDRQAVAAERRRRGIPPARPRRPPIEWTDDMIALLGADSDAAVARALGISRGSVAGKRGRLGIPPFNPAPHDQHRGFPWQPEDLALLGKVSDGELARTLGLARTSVTNKRQKLGIPPFQPAPRPIEWTSAMIERLGRASDSQVAEELGISAQSVTLKRQALGIPATLENRPVERNEEVVKLLRFPDTEVLHRTGLNWRTIQRLRRDLGMPEVSLPPAEALSAEGMGDIPSSGRERRPGSNDPGRPEAAWRAGYRWRAEEIALVGPASDEEIAARLGRSVEAVRSRRQKLEILHRRLREWQPGEIAQLGRATDREVGARLGRSETAVRKKRWRVGVPAFSPTAGRRWTTAEEGLLGTAPDEEVARRTGRAVEAVAQRRRRVLQRKRDGGTKG